MVRGIADGVNQQTHQALNEANKVRGVQQVK